MCSLGIPYIWFTVPFLRTHNLGQQASQKFQYRYCAAYACSIESHLYL